MGESRNRHDSAFCYGRDFLCHMSLLCSMFCYVKWLFIFLILVELLTTWYWWNYWPSLFELYFHNYMTFRWKQSKRRKIVHENLIQCIFVCASSFSLWYLVLIHCYLYIIYIASLFSYNCSYFYSIDRIENKIYNTILL